MDLGDEGRGRKRRGSVGDNRRAGGLIGVVAKASAKARATLNDDLELELFDESRHAVRRECDPLLAGSGLGWNADFHEVTGVGARASRELTRAVWETLLSLKLRMPGGGANSVRKHWGITTCANLTGRASLRRRMKFDIVVWIHHRELVVVAKSRSVLHLAVRFASIALIATTALPGQQPAAPSAEKPLPLKHAPQPTTPAITAADLMTRLYIFADDSMMGREVGTPNHLRATAYIANEAKKLGLIPAGDSGTYFQNLPVFDHTLSPKTSISVDGKTFAVKTDFVPRDNSLFGGTVRPIDNTQVVFGGTLTLPVDTSKLVSPAATEGKFVVIAVGNGPDGKPLIAGYRQPLTGYYIKSAAIAVVALEGFDADQRKALVEPSEGLDDPPPGAGTPQMLPAFLYVTRPMGAALVGAPFDSLKRGAPGKTVHGSIVFESTRAPARNVVAILKGSDPKLAGEYVAIGAHNDHIGFNHTPVDHDSLRAFDAVVRPQGEDDRDRPATAEEQVKIRRIIDSLRKKNPPRLDSIYNGADDDGSGTVATLEIAESVRARHAEAQTVDPLRLARRRGEGALWARSTSPTIRPCRATRSSRSSTWT